MNLCVCVWIHFPFYPRHTEAQCHLMFVCFLFNTFFPLFHLYFYTFPSIHLLSSASFSLFIPVSLCASCHSILAATVIFLSNNTYSLPLYFPHYSSIPVWYLFASLHPCLPLLISLAPSLKSLTYLQHSCLMNNGGETVTISVSISRIPHLILAPLPFVPAFPLNFSLLRLPFSFQLLSSPCFPFS